MLPRFTISSITPHVEEIIVKNMENEQRKTKKEQNMTME
jgi:hypothetical protein